jgi:hypothetical protein
MENSKGTSEIQSNSNQLNMDDHTNTFQDLVADSPSKSVAHLP